MKRPFVVATLASLLLLSAACGGGGGTTGDGDAGSAAGSSEDVEYDTSAVLNYGAPRNDVTSFDPHLATVSQDNPVLFLTYDRLVHMDAEGNEQPGLATDWEFSDDGHTLTFPLREGVTFHDGTPFDAEAAKANLERVRDLPESVNKRDLQMVSAIEVVSPTEITLTLDALAPQLPLVLSDRSGAMLSPAAFDKPDLDRAPVGTGMFRVTEYVSGDHITYERNEDYWDEDAVNLAGMVVRFMEDPKTRLNALRSGQIDWTEVSALDFASLESDPNFEAEVFSGLAYQNLPMDRSHPALADVRVRQALNYGINAEALNEVLNRGLALVCDQAFPPDYFTHNEEIGCDYYPYDPDRARELLAEAGYADGLDLELLTGTTPEGMRLAEAVQAQYADIGVNMIILPDPAAGSSWVVDHKGDLLVGEWGGRASPFITLLQQYIPGGTVNTGNHLDEDLLRAYTAAEQAPTEEERVEHLQEATAIAVEHALDIPLWFSANPNAWASKVVGPEAYIGGKQEFRGVGIAAQ